MFDSLNSIGIIALQNAGFTMSDGLGEVSEELANHDPAAVKGYCFYHEQDVARKDRSGGDSLATSTPNDE